MDTKRSKIRNEEKQKKNIFRKDCKCRFPDNREACMVMNAWRAGDTMKRDRYMIWKKIQFRAKKIKREPMMTEAPVYAQDHV